MEDDAVAPDLILFSNLIHLAFRSGAAPKEQRAEQSRAASSHIHGGAGSVCGRDGGATGGGGGGGELVTLHEYLDYCFLDSR